MVEVFTAYTCGKRERCSFLKQLIRCALIDSCFNCTLLGFIPNARAVAKAMAKTPQSVPPFCFWDCATVILSFSEPNLAMVCSISLSQY